MTDLARKRSRTFTILCINVDFKDNPDRNKRNRLLEFDTDSTWMEVLEEGNVDVGIRKTDTVTVNLTLKMSTDVFHPSLEDAIDAALCCLTCLFLVKKTTINLINKFRNIYRH